MTPKRSCVIDAVIHKIPISRGSDCTLVAIDGRDASGKTTFADELASACGISLTRPIIRISIDDFHNPRSLRYRLGKTSPEGFYNDSYDYDRFRRFVLEPLGPSGSREYKARSHDLDTDDVFDTEPSLEAAPCSVVIVDGLFLQRPELTGAWDMVVYMHATAEVCAERMAVRDGKAPELTADSRYFGGVKMYLDACKPLETATLVVDNNDLANPRFIKGEIGKRVI